MEEKSRKKWDNNDEIKKGRIVGRRKRQREKIKKGLLTKIKRK